MRSRFLSCILLTCACLAPAMARSQELPDGRTELGANAALQYWQAFWQVALLSKDQEKLLADWNSVSLADPAVTKVLDASHNSLMYLHRGSALPRCDWGLDYNDGMFMLMPHLAKSRDLARVAALDARRALDTGDWKSARRDVASIIKLARHGGQDPV